MTYTWVVYETSVNQANPKNSIAFFSVLHKNKKNPAHIFGSCSVDMTDFDSSTDDIVRFVKRSLGSDGVARYEQQLADQLKINNPVEA